MPEFIPYTTRHGSQPASISDLHYRLGKLVEHYPGKFIRLDNGAAINTDNRHFADIEPVGFVDRDAGERLAEWAADHLASLSPERREQLQRDWENR